MFAKEMRCDRLSPRLCLDLLKQAHRLHENIGDILALVPYNLFIDLILPPFWFILFLFT